MFETRTPQDFRRPAGGVFRHRPHPTLLILLTGLALCRTAQAQTPAKAGDVKRGAALYAEQCLLCHATSSSASGGEGPTLAGVVGRRAGATQFAYSGGMAKADFVWTPKLLDRFLAAPSRVVPGTFMARHVASAAERRDLIAYMATLRAAPSQPTVAAKAPPPPPPPPSAAAVPVAAAAGDWRADAPGVRHHIDGNALPAPYATPSAGNRPRVVDRPLSAIPSVPPGFALSLFAAGLENPRLLRVAPNGDVFVAESAHGRIRVLRAPDGASQISQQEVYAEGLDGPFGLAFYPAGPNPEWLYVGQNNSVSRFAYRNGDLHARGAAEVVVPKLAPTSGGHVTRDVVFSADGKRLFVSVGSASNVAERMGTKSPEAVRSWESSHALGATWGDEENRADVLVFTPEGKEGRTFATGLRNCVGMAIQPGTGTLWCSTNERDGLGDNLVPDYVTRVKEGAFFGWPWYYLGNHEEPRLRAARPDLAGQATVPDVLIQSHSASLQMTFYDGAAFPPAFRGAFASEHGSWNRAMRTGYKVIRILLDETGAPTGEYEDFLTGFVVSDSEVWGRPVGVAVAHDGALLVSEDANGTLWRIAYVGAAADGKKAN